jgi:hypothetical protein
MPLPKGAIQTSERASAELITSSFRRYYRRARAAAPSDWITICALRAATMALVKNPGKSSTSREATSLRWKLCGERLMSCPVPISLMS